jgi:hypothetical protein
MRYSVRVYLRSSDTLDLDKFYAERYRARHELARELRHMEPFHDDDQLVFDGVEYKEIDLIEQACGRLGIQFELGITPRYSVEDINAARWVPLLVKGEGIDADESWRRYGREWRRLCAICGYPEFAAIPEPFIVSRQRAKLGKSVFKAANGMFLLSNSLWEILQPQLDGWVQSGRVAYSDAPSVITSDLVWARPTTEIGPYIDRKVIRTCDVCGRPREIRGRFEMRPILMSLLIVEDSAPTNSPIARVGNWFGEVHLDRPPSVTWDIVISGSLHQSLQSLKIRGLVAAEQVVHAKSELPLEILQRM